MTSFHKWHPEILRGFYELICNVWVSFQPGCFGHVQRPSSETEESRKPALFPCCAGLSCSYFLLSPHNWIAASHAACQTKSSVIEFAFVFSIGNHGFDDKINSPIIVYVLKLRMFSWPTPLKYPESKPSTRDARGSLFRCASISWIHVGEWLIN